MFAGHKEHILRARAFQNLIDGVEFFGFRKMTDVAGMQHELWRFAQTIDLLHGRFQRPGNIGISGLVESHVAVADLHEAEFASRFAGANLSQPAQAVRLQDSPFHHAERSGASPCHAFQKSSSIDSIVVVIVHNLVFALFGHRVLSVISHVLPRTSAPALH